MAWVKRKGDLDLVDSKIVTRDFIVAEGKRRYSSWKGKHSIEKALSVPVFYLFKVHRNHPLRIASSSNNHFYVWPVNEDRRGKKDFRFPAEIIRDKMDYDLTTFMLVPSPQVQSKKIISFPIEDGFFQDRSESISEYEKNLRFNPNLIDYASQGQDMSLVYIRHGAEMGAESPIFRPPVEITPPSIANHFFSWLRESKEVFSYDKNFKQILEGNVKVPIERARELTADVINLLEERYNTRLMFKSYKEHWRKERLSKGLVSYSELREFLRRD